MKMKKTFLTAAGILFAVISCNKQNIENTVPNRKPVADDRLVTITLSAEAETRATLSGNAVSWELTDHIGLYDGVALRDFTLNRIDEDGIAYFTGEVDKDADHSNFYAVYPYSAASATLPTAGGIISLNYPHIQTLSTGKISADALVSVAKVGENGNLLFKQVSSLLKIYIPEADIVSVILTGNNSEGLAGAMTCAVGEAPTGTYPVKQITLRPSGPSFSNGDEVYIALPPTTFSNGFTLLYKKDAAFHEVNAGGSVTFARKGGKTYVNALKGHSFSWTSISTGHTITTEAQLRDFAANQAWYGAGEEVKLGGNIELTSAWTPFELKCHLNGNGYTVSGLDVSADTNAGFVSVMDAGAQLSNTTFSGSITLTGTSNTYAGLVADCSGSVAQVTSQVTVSTSKSSGSTSIGGLVGHLGATGSIDSSDNRGNVTLGGTSTSESNAGGVVGLVDSGTIVSCRNFATVTCSSPSGQGIGGIAGLVKGGKLQSCTNSGGFSVTDCNAANGYAGGIAGYLQQAGTSAPLVVSGCTNSGEISISLNRLAGAGGIAGGVHPWHNKDVNIIRCNNTGNITISKNGQIGVAGIIGHWKAEGTLEGNVNRGNISLTNDNRLSGVAGIVGLFQKNTADWKIGLTTRANYNFGTIQHTNSSSTPEDRGGTAGIIGYFHLSSTSYTDFSCSMNLDRNCGDLTATGRAAGIFCSSYFDNRKFSISLTDCKVGDFTIKSSDQGTSTIGAGNATSHIYSYYKNTAGYVTLTQTGSGYISIADAEAELAAR